MKREGKVCQFSTTFAVKPFKGIVILSSPAKKLVRVAIDRNELVSCHTHNTSKQNSVVNSETHRETSFKCNRSINRRNKTFMNNSVSQCYLHSLVLKFVNVHSIMADVFSAFQNVPVILHQQVYIMENDAIKLPRDTASLKPAFIVAALLNISGERWRLKLFAV